MSTDAARDVPPRRFAGIVLCGGKSQRMGRSKANLPFHGEMLLQRVVRRLSEAVSPIVVVAAADQDLPELPAHVECVRDAVAHRGPLEGLAAGLRAVGQRADAVYVSSCDVPLLQPAFVAHMCQLLGNHEACIPRVDGFVHPLAGVYRMEVIDQVEDLLREDRLKLTGLLVDIHCRYVGVEEIHAVDASLLSLKNVNTPEAYEHALRMGKVL